jgi:predicted nucleic acid-binding protein
VILVDTSIWIDHLRTGVPELTLLLRNGRVLTHPWVIGELALGRLTNRSEVLELLRNLPHATVATDAEVLTLIENQQLFGLGIGYVDAHLLSAALLTAGAGIWTRDRRLAATAAKIGLASSEFSGWPGLSGE